MSKTYALIFNPVAGKGKAKQLLPQVRRELDTKGLSYELALTEGVGHAEELAQGYARRGVDALLAAGGDGTCNEVINGLMKGAAGATGRLPTLGIIPIGRGNDFAYGAGVPADLAQACALIAEGKDGPLDIGRISGGFFPDGRYFGNGIGIGFDTIVGLRAAKKKHMHSSLSYLSGALDTLIAYPKAPELTISYNGHSLQTASQQISILNGRRMGGMFYMAPLSERADGLLDLCMVIRPMTRRDMISLILHYLKGTQRRSALIATDRAPYFEIRAPRGGLVCHADGETVCTDGTSLRIECVPGALRIYSDMSLPMALPSALEAEGLSARGEDALAAAGGAS